MRHLPLPGINDAAVLDALGESTAAAAINIAGHHPKIAVQFVHYALVNGDPWLVSADDHLAKLKDSFESLYSQPPVVLAHLLTLRHSVKGACAMCGRDAQGTLDHYLPQADFPEFCFYSKNLVPACNRCNTARRNRVRGAAAGQRALHPYYDQFANKRVLSVCIRPDYRAPSISPIPFDIEGAELEVVRWQIDNVVIPSGFRDYADPIWATLSDTPLELLDDVVPTAVGIVERLEFLERYEAKAGKSPNSWRSVIYHGIRNDQGAVDHLAARLAAAQATPPIA